MSTNNPVVVIVVVVLLALLGFIPGLYVGFAA
jgi:hypothetical protein